MKRGKKLVILILVLAVLCGGAFAATHLKTETAAEDETGDIILSVDANAISELRWTHEGEEFDFTQTEGAWSYAKDSAFPLDESKVTAVTNTIASVEAYRTLSDVTDLSEYGLDSPLCTLTAVTADGEYSLSLGSETPTGGRRYASTGDGNIYLVDSAVFDCFDIGLYDMIERETLPVMSELKSFRIESDTQELELLYLPDSGLAYSDDYVWFTQTEGGYTALDTDAVTELIGSVTELSWSSCVSYNAEELSLYGLDEPDVRAEVSYTTDETDGTLVLLIGDYSDNGSYAMLEGSKMVYEIDSAITDALLYTGADALAPDDVIKIDLSSLLSFDVEIGSEKHTVKRLTRTTTDDDGGEQQEVYYTCAGEELDAETLETALYELSMLAPSASDSEASQTRDAMMKITFRYDKADWSEIELVFAEYDSDSCLALVTGQVPKYIERTAASSAIAGLEDALLS